MKNILLASLLIFLAACEKENAETSISNQAIVEAYLTSGAPVEVKLTKIIPFDPENQQSLQTLDSLPVAIFYNNEKFALAPQSNGRYRLDPQILLPEAGERYDLEIEYDGKKLSATTTLPAKPQNFKASASSLTVPTFGSGGGFPTFPDPIELTWASEPDAYYLVVVKNIEADPDPLFDDIDPDDLPNFRSEPVQGGSFEVRFQSFRFLGTHQLILFRIQPEYSTLYQDNGDNSLNLANVPTNITGGLGIFTSIAAADTLFLEVQN
jgi:hypothetical protein